MTFSYDNLMKLAIKQAKIAAKNGEIPVGAIIINSEGTIIGIGANESRQRQCAIWHAEIIAIEQAAAQNKDWRLIDCTIITTCEPCAMCIGAIINSRIKTLVYGVNNPKYGCVSSLFPLGIDSNRFNHKLECIQGIQEKEIKSIMKNFFENIRKNNIKEGI